jgi:hypothetical protein
VIIGLLVAGGVYYVFNINQIPFADSGSSTTGQAAGPRSRRHLDQAN